MRPFDLPSVDHQYLVLQSSREEHVGGTNLINEAAHLGNIHGHSEKQPN